MDFLKIVGFAGQQLRVNLDQWEAYAEPISAEISRDYLGGCFMMNLEKM
jgi:hypothetical protein